MGLKTYDYIVTLKPPRSFAAFNWISHLMMLLALALVIYSAFSYQSRKELIYHILGIVVIVAAWIYSYKVEGKYNRSLLWTAITLGVLYKNLWMLLGYGIAAFLERQVRFQQEIGFDDNGLTFNSFPTKKYQWHEVSNVVLKDDIITVDLYNNKIIQKEIDSEIDHETEKEFNEFCRSHLLSV